MKVAKRVKHKLYVYVQCTLGNRLFISVVAFVFSSSPKCPIWLQSNNDILFLTGKVNKYIIIYVFKKVKLINYRFIAHKVKYFKPF